MKQLEEIKNEKIQIKFLAMTTIDHKSTDHEIGTPNLTW